MNTAKDLLRLVVSDCAAAMIAYRSAADAASDADGRWLFADLARTRARALKDIAPFVTAREPLPVRMATPDLAEADEDGRLLAILRLERNSLDLLRAAIETDPVDPDAREGLALAHARISMAWQRVQRSLGLGGGLPTEASAPPVVGRNAGRSAAGAEP